MLLAIACLFATVAAGPVLYDQRQDGEFNAQVDISNVMLVFAIPKKIPSSLFDIFSKNDKPFDKDHDIQDRSDVRLMEAFVEPNTPYQVDIGSQRSEGDGRTVEVVIAGRRRLESDQDAEDHEDDLKLLGATENCGPGRVRDAITLMCKDIEKPIEVSAEPKKHADQKEVEVVPIATPEVVPS